MTQKAIEIKLQNGLEARPVAVLVQVASKYDSTIYIEVEDGERLQRALDRERAQEVPKFAEMCRRFLTDSEDFAEEKVRAAGVEKRFYNRNLQECLAEIISYILEQEAEEKGCFSAENVL